MCLWPHPPTAAPSDRSQASGRALDATLQRLAFGHVAHGIGLGGAVVLGDLARTLGVVVGVGLTEQCLQFRDAVLGGLPGSLCRSEFSAQVRRCIVSGLTLAGGVPAPLRSRHSA